MDDPAICALRCDVLLLFATSTEEKMLREAAREMGLAFGKRKVTGPHGEDVAFFSLGTVGQNRVNAIRTAMGPLSYGGSASRGIYYRVATGATAIVQVGMAFGVDPATQSIGDVLVATSIIPYDLRIVRSVSASVLEFPKETEFAADALAIGGDEASPVLAIPDSGSAPVASSGGGAGYRVDYSPAIRHQAKTALVDMLKQEWRRDGCEHQVLFGGMLSGGARIFSRSFLGELVRGVPQAADGIVGGEMEGVGLLSVSPSENPMWAVVKGISDFADENRDRTIEQTRPIACRNAARFALSALLHSTDRAR